MYLTNSTGNIYQNFVNQVSEEVEKEVGKVAFLDKHIEGKATLAFFPIDAQGKPVEKLANPLHKGLETVDTHTDISVFSYTKQKTLNQYDGYYLYKKQYKLEQGKYKEQSAELLATYYFKESGETVSFQDLLEDSIDSHTVMELLKTLVNDTVKELTQKEKLLNMLEQKKLSELDYAYTKDQFSLLSQDDNGKIFSTKLDITDVIPYFKETVVFDTYKSVYTTKVAEIREKRKTYRQQMLQNIVNGIKQKVPSKKIALTFDDGPDSDTTPQVLDILEKYQAKATFYMLGSRVAGNENIIKKMVEKGHELGNHSWDHPDLTTLPVEEVKRQVEQTQQAITAASGGVAPKSMRPPYGAINAMVNSHINLPIAMWNVDSLDWKTRSAEKVYEVVTNHIGNGDVVLMHDIHQSTVDSLDRLIGQLKEQGYEMVTLSELYDSHELVSGIQYFSANDAQIVSE
ncbi:MULTISPECIES: polysaccharide deacetylase family protein [unclassified Granulicatella]|uniref:polysaccharide deacetylase family protein n=1 Tax=unclassified Granulicatella TaxID=2630493 RepID=UPI001431878E|nr:MULTISPECIES: polysaccharide deacetylase family protein [unclassified Granulicatella]MBF0780182.1 polysaccharide deacetylase family protein [Granulicatella sp. 19428wC4_WM01]